MKSTETTSKTEQESISKAEDHKGVENHKKAATHFEAAAKSHRDAARYHEEGNHEKAAKSTVEAHGHAYLGREAQKEDAKYHASTVK